MGISRVFFTENDGDFMGMDGDFDGRLIGLHVNLMVILWELMVIYGDFMGLHENFMVILFDFIETDGRLMGIAW